MIPRKRQGSRSQASGFGPLSTTRYSVRGVNFDMVRVPPGRFVDGGGAGRRDLLLSYPFEIGVTVVTAKLWWALMERGAYPETREADRPRGGLTPDAAQDFLERLNQSGLHGFRLSGEAEWAWAVRCGVPTNWAGSDRTFTVMQEEGAVFEEVAQDAPSAVGAFNLSGGMWEWQRDYWSGGIGGGIDVKGPDFGEERVARGGWVEQDDWGGGQLGLLTDGEAENSLLGINLRDDGSAGDRLGDLGIRLVRVLR